MTAGRQSVSRNKDWGTPPTLVESIRTVFGGTIGLDPCSNRWSIVNAKIEYSLPEHDGLKEPWKADSIYVNPPYGSDPVRGTRIIHWFQKIVEAYHQGSEVIALVPVATNARHWKLYVYPEATAICFLYAPRLRFYIEGKEDPKGAPMSCAVIYYGSKPERFAAEFVKHGAVVPLQDVLTPEHATHQLSLLDG